MGYGEQPLVKKLNKYVDKKGIQALANRQLNISINTI